MSDLIRILDLIRARKAYVDSTAGGADRGIGGCAPMISAELGRLEREIEGMVEACLSGFHPR